MLCFDNFAHVEDSSNLSLRGAKSDYALVSTIAERKAEAAEDNWLTGARFATDGREVWAKLNFEVLHGRIVLD